MNWDQMRRQYYSTDGTFRDVFATEMDSLAWQKFFELMQEQTLTFHTSEEGVAAESTAINTALVEKQWDLKEYVPYIRLQLTGGTKIKFYFFAPEELEGIVDPRDIKSEARHRELKSFLGKIADATDRVVKFAQENNREKVLYQLTPRAPKPAEAAAEEKSPEA